MDAANSPSLLVMLLIMSAWLSAGDKASIMSDHKSVDAGGPAAVRHLLHAFGMAYSKAAADGGWVLMSLDKTLCCSGKAPWAEGQCWADRFRQIPYDSCSVLCRPQRNGRRSSAVSTHRSSRRCSRTQLVGTARQGCAVGLTASKARRIGFVD